MQLCSFQPISQDDLFERTPVAAGAALGMQCDSSEVTWPARQAKICVHSTSTGFEAVCCQACHQHTESTVCLRWPRLTGELTILHTTLGTRAGPAAVGTAPSAQALLWDPASDKTWTLVGWEAAAARSQRSAGALVKVTGAVEADG